MSSIQAVPVEILLDIFEANDPAGTEALRLTCRRFNFTILENVDTLPTRIVCDLLYGTSVYGPTLRLYRALENNECTYDESGGEKRELIASEDPSPKGLQHLYQMFGRNIAIRKVEVGPAKDRRRPDDAYLAPDPYLMQLIEHFPSVKGAASLEITYACVLPTDAVLDHFGRLETIEMDTWVDKEDSSFWSVLFHTKAFRRACTFVVMNSYRYNFEYPHVDDAEMFDFITDCSLMSADKPRVVSIGHLPDKSLESLERRFDENIASIGGQVCAVIKDRRYDEHYLTNMDLGSRQETLAKQLPPNA